MAKRIDYSREAQQALRRIDQASSRRIRAKIALLATNPAALANNVRTLKGEFGLRRLRIGDWRVIYTDDLCVLHVVRIAARGSVYE